MYYCYNPEKYFFEKKNPAIKYPLTREIFLEYAQENIKKKKKIMYKTGLELLRTAVSASLFSRLAIVRRRIRCPTPASIWNNVKFTSVSIPKLNFNLQSTITEESARETNTKPAII